MKLATLALAATITASAASADVNYSTLDRANEETKILVKKIVAGLGGELTLREIQSVRKVATIREADETDGTATEINFTGVAVFPSSLYARMQMSGGEVIAVATPRSSHMFSSFAPIAGAAMKLDDKERNSFVRYFYEDPIFVLKNRIDPSCLFAHAGSIKIGNKKLELLFVRITGFELQWFIDPETGRVLRTVTGDVVNDFADFRKVGGIVAPFSVRTTRNGKLVSAERAIRYDINGGVEENAFAVPTLWLSRSAMQTQQTEWKRKYGRSSYEYDSDDDSRFTVRRYLPPPTSRVRVGSDSFW